MTMTVVEMMQSYPGTIVNDRDLLAECVASCIFCAQACTACADACLGEEAIADLRTCIRTNLDCADICQATGRVLSRNTGYDADVSRAQLEACAEACASSAMECQMRADGHAHCRICADECRRCEDVCRRLLTVMR
jgi:hypothetical protein